MVNFTLHHIIRSSLCQKRRNQGRRNSEVTIAKYVIEIDVADRFKIDGSCNIVRTVYHDNTVDETSVTLPPKGYYQVVQLPYT